MKFTITQLHSILLANYDLQAESIKELPGEADFNFQCLSHDNYFTLKISPQNTNKKELEFQIALVNHLAKKGLKIDFPHIVKTSDLFDFKQITINGTQYYIRLQSWVDGKMMDNLKYHSPELLYDWGYKSAIINQALKGLVHPYAHRSYVWNPSETLISRENVDYFQFKQEVEIANNLWNRFEQNTLPILDLLPKQINHNDLHGMNILVEVNDFIPSISGVIDFGDALYTERINELAITCAYAMMNKPDPIEAAFHVIKGFNDYTPITELEIQHLLNFICARLLITVSSSAKNKHLNPKNSYLQVSEKPAWDLLYKLYNLNTNFVHYRFRTACGLDPHPKNALFIEWAKNNEQHFCPILDQVNKTIQSIDLSVSSKVLGNTSNYLDISKFQKRVFRYMEDQGVDIAIGGYSEIRPFYTTESYMISGNEGAMWRTMHLGMDFWTFAGSKVICPYDAVVHSVYNNEKDCDYGPTIILKHKADFGAFYSLYGHLSLESLDLHKIGDKISGGDIIAYIGNYPINGNWPPHLHFQIMLDHLGNKYDFPGVAFVQESETWLSICPDPKLLCPKLPIKNPIHSAENKILIENRMSMLGKGLSISYNKHLQIVRGYKQHLYDQYGRRYLDTVNNVAHVGHEHEYIVKNATDQIELINTNTRYLHKNLTLYAKSLLDTFPPELSVVHFVNSGSEANELALRMAKTVSNGDQMIAIEVAYHGNTGNTIDISSYKFDGDGGNGKPQHTHLLPLPDLFRQPNLNNSNPADYFTENLKNILNNIVISEKELAGFIAESILSCGGQIVLPDNYLKTIYSSVRKQGGICIADEVQTGFGRIGSHFWAFESQDVVPDIVTLGKPIGNGHPIGAVITTKAIAEQFANGMEYFNTYGGNPVSCTIGQSVLDIIAEESLQENAQTVGQYLKQALSNLSHKHDIIGDVRGLGLFLGIELITDELTKAPAAKEADYIINRMKERGILMSTDGPLHNVLKIKPPICFTILDADFLMENLEIILNELEQLKN